MGGGFGAAAGASPFSPLAGAAAGASGGEDPSVEARILREGLAAMEGFSGEVLCILTNAALREAEMEELEAVGSDSSVAEAIAAVEAMVSKKMSVYRTPHTLKEILESLYRYNVILFASDYAFSDSLKMWTCINTNRIPLLSQNVTNKCTC